MHKNPTLKDAYVYALAEEACDDDHHGKGWHGLLRGHLDVSATARLEYPISDNDVQFLETQAGAIVREHEEGQYYVDYYADEPALESAWSGITALKP